MSQREDLSRLEVRFELPVPGIAAANPSGPEPTQPGAEAFEIGGKEALGVAEDPGVVDHVEKQRAAGLDLLGALEHGGERDREASRVVSLQSRLEPSLDREELLDAIEPTARQVANHEQQVDIRIESGRAAPYRAEHGAGNEPTAVVRLQLGRYLCSTPSRLAPPVRATRLLYGGV